MDHLVDGPSFLRRPSFTVLMVCWRTSLDYPLHLYPYHTHPTPSRRDSPGFQTHLSHFMSVSSKAEMMNALVNYGAVPTLVSSFPWATTVTLPGQASPCDPIQVGLGPSRCELLQMCDSPHPVPSQMPHLSASHCPSKSFPSCPTSSCPQPLSTPIRLPAPQGPEDPNLDHVVMVVGWQGCQVGQQR